jgi:hypothetical protein
VVVTTNSELRRDGRPCANQRIEQVGVAVYVKRKGRSQVTVCTRWNSIHDYLQAAAKTIEALGGIDRRGTGEMVDAACAGFTAIPASASGGTPVRPKRPWHWVLGVSLTHPGRSLSSCQSTQRRITPTPAEGTRPSRRRRTPSRGYVANQPRRGPGAIREPPAYVINGSTWVFVAESESRLILSAGASGGQIRIGNLRSTLSR